MGYEVIGRDELDPSGKPFPILHLQQPVKSLKINPPQG